ncbi:MurR/RpiR family transcriptional regulator [Aureimonas jatrophae]|uniref:DNA-binding transcriptional regulator, MurR/RpiR family, contains HTH and SIS domains n=1 Tax=Aureimonas jatrophae TaxID=1166073 RepID=A0A1H0MMR4_9HYPH|nr:MurR/RpiR family transcriptional regulator [Aureimonas jatrophae]MBB3952886.1 DNA-binding MurR/RpiR family transcriptional regulator [Aureimonas jatrophae]SDO81595.1 DNA-binding transcriptional regulator, MurR/RpiR family, contains HTH and SIS domains [Aureimonas jatrophae]
MSQALLAKLRSLSSDMTPALARVADAVLAQPETTLYQSITELAETSNSSEASVMRFCRDQGFSGFQDFKLALAKELATDNRAAGAGEPTDDIQRLVETAVVALRETEQLIVRADVATAAERLLRASLVESFGVAASAITAQYLAYKMSRVGRVCRSHCDASLAIMAAGTAPADTVQVVVSSSGSTIDAVRVAEVARSSGAFVIGITNRAKSPLVAACDLTLVASWPETPLTGGAFPSKISQLLIVDALIGEMGRQDPHCLATAERTAEVVSDRSF